MLVITVINSHVIIKVKPIFEQKSTPVQDLTLKKRVSNMSINKVNMNV